MPGLYRMAHPPRFLSGASAPSKLGTGASMMSRTGSLNRLEYSSAICRTSTGNRGPHIVTRVLAHALGVVGSLLIVQHVQNPLELRLHIGISFLKSMKECCVFH